MEGPVREVTSSMMDLFLQAKWNTKGVEKKIESKIGGRFSKVGWLSLSTGGTRLVRTVQMCILAKDLHYKHQKFC